MAMVSKLFRVGIKKMDKPYNGLSSYVPKLKVKQVRTNNGLADTLIPSSVIYLIYMGGNGPYDSINIIFGYHVNS